MVLVTGASGMLGSHVLLSLLKKGYQVKALSTSESSVHKALDTFKAYHKDDEKLFSQIKWCFGNINDGGLLYDLLEGVDYVYHCAAIVSFSPQDLEKMNETNIKGTEVLVNMCLHRNIKKFCHVSSVAALGKTNGDDMVTEDTYFVNSPQNSNYGISKYNAEREVWRAAEEGLKVVVVNPSVILGPGDWRSGSSNMFSNAYKGLKYYSNGVTGFVDVRDVAEIMIRLTESKIEQERFIICSENLQYAEVFNMIHDAFGVRRPYIKASAFLAAWVWRFEKLKSYLTGSRPLITKETVSAAFQQVRFSNQKISKSLQYQFKPVTESVREICEIYKAQHNL
jgi:nucleoside-diphosphate-sugar epimerase